jgi:hypothetical protein
MHSRRLRPALLFAAALLLDASPARAAHWPRFTLFSWLAPTPELTDSLHVADYARVGLNVMLPAWRDSGLVLDTRRRLDLARQNGIVCIAWDRRLRSVNPDDPATLGILDSVVGTWRGHPAFLAYYLGDEPSPDRFALLGKFFARIKERDPDHPGWNNLLGRASFPSHQAFMDYTRAYVAAVRPSVLSNDHYDLRDTGDLGELVENVRGLSEVAREAGLPFWGIIQSIQHIPFRAVTEGELRWQIGTWLSYGARGIGWFTYWTPTVDTTLGFQLGLVDSNGVPTSFYDRARRINLDTRAIGETLAGATWLSTQYAGFLPLYGDPFVPDAKLEEVEGRAAIGRFRAPLGAELWFVANSDSAQPARIVLTPGAGAGRTIDRLATTPFGWMDARAPDGRIDLDLAAGEFALLRVTPLLPVPLTQPALELRPNPARSTVALTAHGAGPGARITIRDALGRIVRTLREVPDGTANLTWDGSRDGGGRAATGLYFVRLESAAGAITRRLLWLSPSR